jgi:hypothetical protein
MIPKSLSQKKRLEVQMKDYIKEAEKLLNIKKLELSPKCKNDENWVMVKDWHSQGVDDCKPIVAKLLEEIDDLKNKGFVISEYTYETRKIATNSIEDFVQQVNALEAHKIISISLATPDNTDTRQWYSVYYEKQIR